MPYTFDEIVARIPEAKPAELYPGQLEASPNDPWPTPYGDHPPASFLMDLHPDFDLDADYPETVITAEGQVNMLAWPYDGCHISDPAGNSCWTPVPSPTGNSRYHLTPVITAEGASIPTGGLLVENGHLKDPASTVEEAQQYYNNPELSVGYFRIIETERGGILAGALRPGTTHAQVARMRSQFLSGDWRPIRERGGEYDVIAPVLVGEPGLVPAAVMADGATQTTERGVRAVKTETGYRTETFIKNRTSTVNKEPSSMTEPCGGACNTCKCDAKTETTQPEPQTPVVQAAPGDAILDPETDAETVEGIDGEPVDNEETAAVVLALTKRIDALEAEMLDRFASLDAEMTPIDDVPAMPDLP